MHRRLAFLFLIASPLAAHDFWIEPSTFRPRAGEIVKIGLRVGENFAGDAVPRDDSRIESFVARHSGGDTPVIGRPNQDPAGFVRVEPGRVVIGYRNRPARLELDAEKFEAYLRQEGLERIIPSIGKAPVRELYSRSAKSILGTGDGAVDEPFGYRIELVPESDPLAGEELRVRLLYESKPLEGALIVALHRDDPAARVRVRSDRHGRATLNLPKRGVWLIKAVHMVPAPAGSNADWESLWASLTFER